VSVPAQQAAAVSSMLRQIAPLAVKAMLNDGEELALVDLREELDFSQGHLLWARSIPLSRLELNFARLVPRLSTRIVLCDAGEGLVPRAATVLARAGYTNLHALEGGIAGWAAAGLQLFSGVNVPSKAFGEFIEHDSGTPSVSAEELDKLIRSGTKMVVLDSRPFDEYQRVSIPTGVDVPGAELVLRVHDMAPSPDTLVVVNCAGRTRSIIGAQSLINAGAPNKVVALRNGTMGWSLAGLTCESGQTRRAPQVSPAGLAWAKSASAQVAHRFGVTRIDRATLERWRGERDARTLYLFDVRDPSEYTAGHVAGAISAPGGQLVQATDQYVGTLGARIVLVDDAEVRAVLAATDGLEGRVRAGRSRQRDRSTGADRAWCGGAGGAAHHRSRARRAYGEGRRCRDRPLTEPRVPQGAYSGRLVCDPRATGHGAEEDPVARYDCADIGRWRARRARCIGGAGARRAPGPLSRWRQRSLARRRPAAHRRRRPHGGRGGRRLAQALRTKGRHDQGDG
jgi:rhodanese-related sulfurtransferase